MVLLEVSRRFISYPVIENDWIFFRKTSVSFLLVGLSKTVLI